MTNWPGPDGRNLTDGQIQAMIAAQPAPRMTLETCTECGVSFFNYTGMVAVCGKCYSHYKESRSALIDAGVWQASTWDGEEPLPF
ncbi:MAG: hypothetical protein GY841_10225 [FCB group bacterium]|nr:hypothetical protein [FCB group bacterium]